MALNNKNKKDVFELRKKHIYNSKLSSFEKKELFVYLNSLYRSNNITTSEMNNKFNEKFNERLKNKNREDNARKVVYENSELLIKNSNLIKEDKRKLLIFLNSLNDPNLVNFVEMRDKFQEEYDNTIKKQEIINQKKQEIYNQEKQKIINLNIPKEKEKILLNYLESLNQNINITPEEIKQKSEKEYKKALEKQKIFTQIKQKIINLNIPKEKKEKLLNYLESLNQNINITTEEMKQKSEKIIKKQEIYNQEKQKIINLNLLQEDKNELLNHLNVFNEMRNISYDAMEKKINDEIDIAIEFNKELQPTFNKIVEHEKEQINNSNLLNEKKKELRNFLKILSNSKIFSNNEIEYKFEKKFNYYIKENDLICKKNDSIKLKKSQIIKSELPNDVKNILFNYLGELSKIEPFNIDYFNNKFDYKFIQIVKNFESKPEGYSSDQKIAISNKKKLINESSLPFNKKVELKEYVNYLTQSKSFNVDDFDKEFNVNFNQVINDYDKLIKSKSKINYNENSNLKNYQKNDIEELKYIPIDSKTITCNKCGKKLKKTHFFSKNGKYSSICKKCYEKKIAAKYLEDILKYLSPNQKFDESIFLKNHPDFNAEMINTLKEQNLIDINLETNETSLTSNVVIENFFKEQNQSTYKSNINNLDNIDIKQINEKLDDIIRENLEIKKSLKEKDLEIKKLKDLIPNE